MGAVYVARDTRLDVRCAIKENLFLTRAAQRQFEREARLLAKLRHPNLPRVTDHFFIPGMGQYLAMDFVEGDDLRARVKHEGAAPASQVLTWAENILDALIYLHEHGVVHRDVKPANIKITPAGIAILVDFGIAKEIDSPDGITTTGARGLTPGFSPPEQYGQIPGGTDARSDVYSLGASLYAALTGGPPADAQIRLRNPEDFVSLAARTPALQTSLGAVIDRSLAMDPKDRFPDARAMKEAVQLARGETLAVSAAAKTVPLPRTPPPDVVSPERSESAESRVAERDAVGMTRRRPWRSRPVARISMAGAATIVFLVIWWGSRGLQQAPDRSSEAMSADSVREAPVAEQYVGPPVGLRGQMSSHPISVTSQIDTARSTVPIETGEPMSADASESPRPESVAPSRPAATASPVAAEQPIAQRPEDSHPVRPPPVQAPPPASTPALRSGFVRFIAFHVADVALDGRLWRSGQRGQVILEVASRLPHKLELRNQACSVVREFEVDPGDTLDLGQLQFDFGSLVVSCLPPAFVVLNGDRLDEETPYRSDRICAGQHTITVYRDGYLVKSARLIGGALDQVDHVLPPADGEATSYLITVRANERTTVQFTLESGISP